MWHIDTRAAVALLAITLSTLVAAAAGQEDNGSLRGRCVDADGQPVPGVTVSLYQTNYDQWRMLLQGAAITDTEGRFRFEGGPAPSVDKRAVVVARVKSHAIGCVTAMGPPSDPDGIVLQMGEAATLRGTVFDRHGNAAEGASVWVASIGGAMHAIEPLAELQTFTNARGEFAVEGLPSGVQLDVRIHHAGHVFARITTVSAPDAMRVDLEPGGAVMGRVVFENTGEPAAGVVVQAQGVDGHPDPMRAWMATRTEDDGSFRLDCLPPGSFNIWAVADGWTVVAHDSFDVGVGENRAPDLTLVRGGWIEGVVTDAITGKPMPEAMIGLYGPARPKSGAAIESVHVESDGTFRIRAAPGPNYVYLCTAAITAPATWVTVAGGETNRVEFRASRIASGR